MNKCVDGWMGEWMNKWMYNWINDGIPQPERFLTLGTLQINQLSMIWGQVLSKVCLSVFQFLTCSCVPVARGHGSIPQEERSFVALICYLIYLLTLKLLKRNFFIFLSSYSFLITVNNFQPTGRIWNGKNDLWQSSYFFYGFSIPFKKAQLNCFADFC